MSELRSEATRATEERGSRRRQKIQRQLDEALAGTFPASDPVAILTSTEEEDEEQDEAGDSGAACPAGPAATAPSAPARNPPGSRS
jgi:hypothetical protein